MKKYSYLILIPILLAGFIFRLHNFSAPIADWHSWRQADTSSVSRNFVKDGFDLLHPKFDDISNVPSGIDNPEGYRFVEFPIYNFLQALLFKSIGSLTLEEWGRIITIFSSLFSALLIYFILKRHHSETAGLIGAFFFSMLPFSVYWGRTILPDSSTSAAILAGIYFFDLWIGENGKDSRQGRRFLFFVLSLFFTTTAFLLKPFALFFILPMIYLAFRQFGMGMIKKYQLWLFAALALIPLSLWRIWISNFPEGVPYSAWLFNADNIRFKGAYFYWIFAERIGKLILGYWGVGILIAGLLAKVRKDGLFLYSFLAASLLYLIVIAKGNVQHDYYQILILPTICIFLGLGGDFLLKKNERFQNRFSGPLIFLVLSSFTLFFSWYYVRDFFNINNPAIVIAGKEVDRILPKDARIIANYNGDTSFLYQTNRKGWPLYQHDLSKMVELGADYLVLVNPTSSDYEYAKDYRVVKATTQYVIFSLHEKP